MATTRAHISRLLLGATLAATLATGSPPLPGVLASAGAHSSRIRHGASHRRALHRGRGRACRRPRGHARRARCARAAKSRRVPHRRHALHASRPSPASRPLVLAAGGPCPNAELTPTASNLPEIRAATLCLINKARAENGEPPLKDNGKLDAAAQEHSGDMVARDYFDHTTPSGEAFDARIASAGYVPSGWSYELGENIECGTLSLSTPAAAVKGWMSSPEHRANILNEEFRDSGIGVAPSAPAQYSYGQPGATYTQDFGVVVSS